MILVDQARSISGYIADIACFHFTITLRHTARHFDTRNTVAPCRRIFRCG